MRTHLKGINIIRRRLATGEVRTYYYHRATNTRLQGEPGSPEFLSSIAAAVEQCRQRDAGTLGGLIREFQQTAKWRRLAETTQNEYRRIFKFWEDQYGTCPYPALEDKAFRRAVIKWHDAFSEAKPREADNRVTVLARVLSWATRDGPLKRNVLDGFERAYQSDRSDKIWLPEHVEAFMAVASPEMKLAMVLALHTGQRRGDLLQLNWNNYDGERISLRQGKSRRGKIEGRLVTIKCTRALKETLDHLPKRSTLILTTKTGKAFKKRYFALQWEKTCREAGIEDLHFHDIRGTTVTMLFQAGCNLGEIVSITGHCLRRAQDILDKYLARTSTMADNAIAKFENVLETDSAKHTAKQDRQNHAK
ncbi:tyrosine-type recombinase/integrase [Roseibium alexandrii]|uniref:Phage integrase family n=1 Tax=Roseibium alexandrii (strain DSM 17067 / NCIMB 14079 / DFL-11) TaxID=244592 RepID=A0A5E8GW24_ROSAD|nr:tyrosine-type recombinase/integrase [Roseibium alexandrii]EEE44113.1 Phage integrase family [Roseibium alexandrii DFL-11]